MTTLQVTVDALMAQGQGNLAVRLIGADEQPLPAFDAGAHIDLQLPNGLTRQYSIASAPHQRDHYVLCIRKEEQSRGGSAYVHEQLRVGTVLSISLPRNVFALAPARHYVLMAGGIGITPLLAMAEQLDNNGSSFELHYYVRQKKQAAFAARLNAGFKHGTVYVYSSNEGQSPRLFLPAALGLAATEAGAVAAGDVPATRLYVCGSHGFMQHVTESAKSRGWDPSTIHQEAFAPAKSMVLAEAANSEDAAFEVALSSSQQIFVVPTGKSIATVLTEAGINVPLSCEMGICGACLTPVTEGVIDHRDSVQSEAEKSATQQHIALCCSRSCSPRLTLDL